MNTYPSVVHHMNEMKHVSVTNTTPFMTLTVLNTPVGECTAAVFPTEDLPGEVRYSLNIQQLKPSQVLSLLEFLTKRLDE